MSPVLSVRELKVHFLSSKKPVHAVDGVSFDIQAGEAFGLVGESGCGKSTLGKAIVRIIEPTAGSIHLKGTDITSLDLKGMLPHRRVVQMIFQDPYGSLNPRKTIRQILYEPLDVQKIGTPGERRARVDWLVQRVGLGSDMLERYPHEFSGGQRQRIGIARALASGPELLVCDEPVSALDVSIQAQVINLLKDLQKELGLSLIFISHDLSVVQYVADRIAVMYRGKIVEMSSRNSLWRTPLHPFTKSLMSSILIPDPKSIRKEIAHDQRSDILLPEQEGKGCNYAARCRYASETCLRSEPRLEKVDGDTQVACHEVNGSVEVEKRPIRLRSAQ